MAQLTSIINKVLLAVCCLQLIMIQDQNGRFPIFVLAAINIDCYQSNESYYRPLVPTMFVSRYTFCLLGRSTFGEGNTVFSKHDDSKDFFLTSRTVSC